MHMTISLSFIAVGMQLKIVWKSVMVKKIDMDRINLNKLNEKEVKE